MQNETFMKCVWFYENYQRYPYDFEKEEKNAFSCFSEKDFKIMDKIIDFIFSHSRLPSISSKKEKKMCDWILKKQSQFDDLIILMEKLEI